MSPGSLEAAGLISQSEYLKVTALTQSASPDAHKKIVGKFFISCLNYKGFLNNMRNKYLKLFFFCSRYEDFFGKVKDKAENMERIIKEKDKHGNERKVSFLWLHFENVFFFPGLNIFFFCL